MFIFATDGLPADILKSLERVSVCVCVFFTAEPHSLSLDTVIFKSSELTSKYLLHGNYVVRHCLVTDPEIDDLNDHFMLKFYFQACLSYTFILWLSEPSDTEGIKKTCIVYY